MGTDRKNSGRLSRRRFLQYGGGAAVAGAAAGVLPAIGSAAAVPDSLPARWDETFDVVVIGSGFAGLAAAYEAKKAGASVVILEKMRTPGGNSIVNGGVVAAPGSPLQKAKGIQDSPELLYKDMVTAGLGLNHPDLAKMVCESAMPTVQWTIDELGVKYKEHVTQEGGHSVPRMYSTYNQSGSAIVQALLAKLKAIGQEVRLQAFLKRIYRDKDGRVKGVQIREGYLFPKEESGKLKNIRARKAVILAFGGFSQDIAFRTIHDPKLTAKFDTTNQPGATAEGCREALRIGCTPIHLSWIQVAPWGSPDEKGFGIAAFFGQGAAAQYGVWINAKTGKRFVNELADRKIRADAIIKIMNDGNQCLALSDAHGVKLFTTTLLPKFLDRKVVKKYETWDEVAAAYDVPLGALKETVASYNKYLAQGKDDEFNRYLQKDAKPLGTPPFYVMRLMPKVHHCMGGVNINVKAQALDVANDEPIPGLYAAGEATGGVHGAVRLGSVACVDCLVFGRIAGKNAVAEKPWGKG